jgi:hypothetical protein
MTGFWKFSVGVLLVVAAFALYNWLNLAVSLDHARQQQQIEWERSEMLGQFILVSNTAAKRADILRAAQQLGKKHILKEEPGRIELDGVVFRFDGDQVLTKVEPLKIEIY